MTTTLSDPLKDPAFVLRVADLSHRKATQINVTPLPETVNALKSVLGVDGLRKISLRGQIEPAGGRNFRLRATVGATFVQPCIVTLAPVSTRIDEPVERLYVAGLSMPDEAEVEMPEDDSVEALPDEIDLIALLSEALALNVPAYPRADGAEAGDLVFTEPGKDAMTDADARPFAGLAGLKARLDKDGA